MSSTAARLVTGTSSGNVVSVQVPLFRIIPGRYMTALWPSIGDWLSSVDHCPVRVSRIRVVVSGPGVHHAAVRRQEHERVQRHAPRGARHRA